MQRRFLNVVTHIHPKYGGLSTSVPAACAHFQKRGEIRAPILAFCDPDEVFRPDNSCVDVEMIQRGLSSFFSPKHWSRVLDVVESSTALHLHGLWAPEVDAVAAIARRLRKPYVYSAHGMLDRWAMSRKRFKKSVYKHLIEKQSLLGAVCVRALTSAEVEDYKRFGVRIPVTLIPNAVDVPAEAELQSEAFLQRYPLLQRRQLVLYLGRLHPKKGLDVLLRSFAKVWPHQRDAHLVIVGPDDLGMTPEITRLAEELGIANAVSMLPPVYGAERLQVLAAASVFVLPSRSEGLSMALLEALASGLPAVITPACNLPDIEKDGCGWVVPLSPDALSLAMEAALRLTPTQRLSVAQRARQFIGKQYGWDVVTKQLNELYEWVSSGSGPSSLRVY